MRAQLQEAQSQLRVDRRFAEITASFNGINLRQRYPDLDREQRAELVRLARRLLRDQDQIGSADALAGAPEPPLQAPRPGARGAATGSVSQSIATPGETGFQSAPTFDEPRFEATSEPRYSVSEGPEWIEPRRRGEAGRRSGNRFALWLLVIGASIAAGFAWYQRETLLALLPPSEPPPVQKAVTDPPVAAKPEGGNRADVKAIIERHQDKLATPDETNAPATAAVEPDSTVSQLSVETETPVGEPMADPSPVLEEKPDATSSDDASAKDAPVATLTESAPATTGGNENAGAEGAEQSAVVAAPQPDKPAAPKVESEAPERSQSTPKAATEKNAEPARQVVGPAASDDAATAVETSAPASAQPRSSTSPSASSSSPPYDALADESLVQQIQGRLRGLGFDPGPIDGVMGWQTYKAIRAFQQSKGLAVDGQPTDLLLGALVSYGRAADKAQ
jgi:hypothetical protein